jgi:flagellar hook assembly protein FlgD
VFANHLAQNFPNPFNPTTTIVFSLKEKGHVELTIFDVRGAVVRRLLRGEVEAGLHADVQWDGLNDEGKPVASGLYFYRLTASGFTETRKMLLLK